MKLKVKHFVVYANVFKLNQTEISSEVTTLPAHLNR